MKYTLLIYENDKLKNCMESADEIDAYKTLARVLYVAALPPKRRNSFTRQTDIYCMYYELKNRYEATETTNFFDDNGALTKTVKYCYVFEGVTL